MIRTTIIGLIAGLLTTSAALAIYFVESIVFTIVFNKMAPLIVEKFEINLPIVHVSMWFVWGAFILIHFVGKVIQIITPKILNKG